jgi:hypothetical protein
VAPVHPAAEALPASAADSDPLSVPSRSENMT